MATKLKLRLKDVEDSTECSICFDVFYDPKMLPCFHAFCLKCIEQYVKEKQESDPLTCPLCREEFEVPTGGLSKLRGNLYLEVSNTTTEFGLGSRDVVCDVCLVGKNCREIASTFCTECQQTMCEPCSIIHGSLTMSRYHQVSRLGEVLSSEVELEGIRKHFCEKHSTEEMKFYCRECSVPTCGTCSMTEHDKHDISDIAEMAEQIKKRLKVYSENASNLMLDAKERSGQVSKEIDSIKNSIEQMRRAVMKRGEHVIQVVLKMTEESIGKLNWHKTFLFKLFENTKKDLETKMVMCDSFQNFCTEIFLDADPVEIIRSNGDLIIRAAEFNGMSIPEIETYPRLQFNPLTFEIEVAQETIAGNPPESTRIDAYQISKPPQPRFQRSVEMSDPVQGIASSVRELYFVTDHSPYVIVCDIDTLAHLRDIPVEGLIDGNHIAAHADVLYVSDTAHRLIHRVQLSDDTSSHWSVGSLFLGVSINKKGHIIVPCLAPDKIVEYSPVGTLIREIRLNGIGGTAGDLQHAIQLDDHQFLICCSSWDWRCTRIYIVGRDGRMLRSYGGGEDSGARQLIEIDPCYLAIDHNGFILVADKLNQRVVQLNSSLEFIGEFIPPTVGGRDCIVMHLDQERNCLYIVEDEENILIFDL